MLRNYITVALRNILKHKFFAAINIFGLVIGMACCLLIFVYVTDELSYDRFHQDFENIYRVGLQGKIAGQEIFTTASSLPLAPTMQTDIPGIEQTLRMRPVTFSSGIAFRYEELVIPEHNVFYADSNFFQFFSFNLLKGDPSSVLREPNSVVLTEDVARKYFGKEDPIGKILVIGNNKWPCKVTGISEPAPSNSHFHFNAIISFATVEKDFFTGWTGNSWQTYVRKNPQTKAEAINAKLEEIVAVHVGKEVEEGLGISFEEFKKQGGIYSYSVYPMTDTHLYSKFTDNIEPGSDIQYVYIFSGVGLFILIIACINFMNLSTARSAGRAKEVGLRKTLGSVRSQMVGQFLAESFIYSMISIIIAIGVAYVVLPQFNVLTGKELSLVALQDPYFVVAALLLVLIVGLLAGSYPAFYLTSFNAVEVLKGKLRAGMRSKGVRSTLVVVQFSVSTFLILSTMIVYTQLSYMQDKHLGLDQHQVINIQNTRRLATNREAFSNSVKSIPGVVGCSQTNNSFPGIDNTTVFRVVGVDADRLSGKYIADWDHAELLKLKIKEGRFFSRDFVSDSTAAVVNEAAVKEFGLENPLEAELLDYNGSTPEKIRIVGVVQDFNFESLKSKVRPMVIRLSDPDGTGEYRNLLIRYEGNPKDVIASVEKVWKEFASGEPFEYTFMDQDYDSLFRAEMRLRNMFAVLAGLTIFIACMGLLALAAFTTEQRTKEIGIRKAMGASRIGLTLLLSKEFTVLVLVSIVPALVSGYFFSNWWLSEFAYRLEPGPQIFAGSALAALVIAWITVSAQALRAASTNPVDSLKYE
ncbi:ABC transporter permease [Oscillatoria amoena NRMC-F 0135]|nr:ABC transporter permease [Oscillatoria amoena NRMC-F 0135]